MAEQKVTLFFEEIDPEADGDDEKVLGKLAKVQIKYEGDELPREATSSAVPTSQASPGAAVSGPHSDSKQTEDSKNQPLAWKKTVKPTASARGGHSATHITVEGKQADGSPLVAGKQYIAVFGGGTRAPSFFADLNLFDIANERWFEVKVTGELPPPRSGHVAAAYANKIFIHGGEFVKIAEEEMERKLYDDVWAFDLGTLRWSQVKTSGAAPARNAHTAHVVGNSLFIIGGSSGEGPTSEVQKLDLETLKWSTVKCTGDVPPAREMHASCLVHSAADDTPFVLVFGGRGLEEIYDDSFAFFPKTSTWLSTGPSPGICGHAAAAINVAAPGGNGAAARAATQAVAVFGGIDGQQFGNSVYLLVLKRATNDALSDAENAKRIAASQWLEIEATAASPAGRIAHSLSSLVTAPAANNNRAEVKLLLVNGSTANEECHQAFVLQGTL